MMMYDIAIKKKKIMPPKLVHLKREVINHGLNLNERYQQCAAEIKMEDRIIGPLQIHQESMQRLTSQHPEGNESARGWTATSTKKKKNVPSRDPIVAIRSMFTPRRTNTKKADLSKVVLPGRRGSILIPVESDGCGSGSSLSRTRKRQQMQLRKELEGLSDLEDESASTTPPSTASMLSLQTGERSDYGGGGHHHRHRRRRSSRRSRYVRKFNSITNVDNVQSDSDSLVGFTKSNGVSSTNEEKGGELKLEKLQQERGRLGRRRSSLFSVDERRASVDRDDSSGGICDLTRGDGTGSSRGNSIGYEEVVLSRRSSIESKDGTSLICKFPSRNSSPGYSGDDDTLICDWGRRQSNASSVGSISNPEEFSQPHEKEKEVSGSLICGWNESQVSILSESTASSTDEKALLHAVESCTLFDVRR